MPSSETLCPASPSLPWVPWASVPHVPGRLTDCRPSVLCLAKTAACPSRVASLLARFPIPGLLPSFRVPRGSPAGGSSPPTPGLLANRSPVPVSGSGNKRLSPVPELPLWTHAPPSDPGGVLSTSPFIAWAGLLPSGQSKPSAFPLDFDERLSTLGPRLYLFRGSITRPASSLHPASHPCTPMAHTRTRVRYWPPG